MDAKDITVGDEYTVLSKHGKESLVRVDEIVPGRMTVLGMVIETTNYIVTDCQSKRRFRVSSPWSLVANTSE